MSNAKTEAEAFLKLQEAASPAPWRYCEAGAMVFGRTDEEHIADAVIDIRGYVAGLPMDGNGRLVAHARNTALPKLTMELAAENERLRGLLKRALPHVQLSMLDGFGPQQMRPSDVLACDIQQALQEPPR